MSKLSNVVKNDVVKKTAYNKLVTKVDNIDTSYFVLKTNYNTKITELENKIPDTSGLVKKTNYNTKITKLENKTPDINNLATKIALTAMENKIPSVNNLDKKADYNTKVTEIENKFNNHDHDKYIGTSEFNTLAANVFNARLAQANLITKADFDTKLLGLNKKITQNKSKHLLVENELNKLKTFDSGYFIRKSHFGEGDIQNYLVFQPTYRFNQCTAESFKPPTKSDNSLNPTLNYYGIKARVKFTGSCLKQSKISYNHGKLVNISIVYELGASSSHFDDLILCVFDDPKLCIWCSYFN